MIRGTLPFLSISTLMLAFAVLTNGCASTPTSVDVAASDPFDQAVRNVGLEEANRQAKAEDRVLIVFGTADWCGPCQRMKANTWTDPRVNEWVHRHAVLYYLDVDEEGPLSDELEIQSIPHMIAFRNGEEIARTFGNRDAESFLDWLHALDIEQHAGRQ